MTFSPPRIPPKKGLSYETPSITYAVWTPRWPPIPVRPLGR
jgi:hypothetical protein